MQVEKSELAPAEAHISIWPELSIKVLSSEVYSELDVEIVLAVAISGDMLLTKA